ncbi:MAG: peptidoglycan-binding protein [Actinomycetota bacterium]|nr:peptidoglycan-binding protein [Actinomycetota bacterium]
MAPGDWPLVPGTDTDFDVRPVQHLLNQWGAGLAVAGRFGPPTTASIKKFQSMKGLIPDGVVGNQTWPRLIVRVQSGSNGDAVRAVQALVGIDQDGVFGPVTDTHVREFQQTFGAHVDGIVGPETWRLLVLPKSE